MVFNPISNARFGHPVHKVGGGHARKAETGHLDKRSNCAGGGFYKNPTTNQTVSTSSPVNVAWDNSCLSPSPKLVDLYLYAPGLNDSLIQAFNGADYAHGSMEMTLNPSWWGNASSVSLQLAIVPHGTPGFMTSIATGPIWTATYNSSDPNAHPKSGNASGSGGIIQEVKNIFAKLPGGSVAAAVILPLLAATIAILLYVRHQRKKRAEKSKRFSQAIDQRMSTISTDWRSISGAGANAAIRASMVDSSAYGRPASFMSSVSSGQAGVGAHFDNLETAEQEVPQLNQLRASRLSSVGQAERTSRTISFAADARPSIETTHTRRTGGTGSNRPYQTRSFHQAQNFDSDEEDADLQLSPRQSQGPTVFSNAEIEARASVGDEDLRREMLQMPAVSLMRTGRHNAGPSNELILPAPILRNASPGALAVPSPTLQPTSPIPPSHLAATSAPMNPALSPDDLLRAYAAGRAANVQPGSTLGAGAQTITGGNKANTGMRILYAPSESPMISSPPPTSAPMTLTNSISPAISSLAVPSPALTPNQLDNNPFRKSMAARSTYTLSQYSGSYADDFDPEDAYSGHLDEYGNDGGGYAR
ncbi:uncharacterized protein EI90DRAFT_3047863 [Cantharellus anzutake]|uniref:uncharacterized protein n=1 Tax=Cantharellus anzutake TaxID=1750568 RepID=UPI001902DB9D|nr:uncharacterized protein EI90DRAFT_3047863 [Cantharellus anzutake]KAF8335304.1 hypothetical protein EI90DRAFT_3047863 [Cantharellus anzutake]